MGFARPVSSGLHSLTLASNHMGNMSKLAIDSTSTFYLNSRTRNSSVKKDEIKEGLYHTNIGIAKSLVKIARTFGRTDMHIELKDE